MILLQNPNMPVPTNAVEIDAAILDIKAHLETGLSWLTNGYGRTYKNLDARNGTTVFYPEAYLGEQNNSHRYINLSPDNDKQGQCFFYVVKETISQFQPGMYSYLSYDTAIIFSVNMELINDLVLQTEIFQQNLVAQVRDVLTRQLMGASYQLTISSVDFQFDNVYSEFDLADAQQLEKAPLSHFRFNCTIKLPEACPVPSITPPVTTCYSLDFDGVMEYVDCGYNGIYNLIDYNLPFTFSVWAKADGLIGLQMLMAKRDPLGLAGGLYLGFNANVLRWGLSSVPFASYTIDTTSALSVGVWYNITATFDGTDATGLNVYVNGVLQPKVISFNTPMSSIVSTTPVTFGAGLGQFYFNGKIAKSRIWKAELTSVQAASEYNSGTILSPAVQGADLIIDTDINNATFGTEWSIPDLTGITAGYESVNMEVEDRVEDCPS